MLSLLIVLGTSAPLSAETWFLPDVFPNHHLAATHKLFGLETVGSGRPVFWMPTLESDYWSTGNWSRTLTEMDQRPCCWDFNQWRDDGDRGRGAYGGDSHGPVYDTWIGTQATPTFPISVDTRTLPFTRTVPAGTVVVARVHRPTDTILGYIDGEGVCCAADPVVIQGGPVLIRFSTTYMTVAGQYVLKLEGWGVDAAGRRTTAGEAFYFCRGCLTVGDQPADGPVRWEVTRVDGTISQQWTFSRWVPRTAQDVVDTMRPELDRLRREVKTLRAGAPEVEDTAAGSR
jgi:hypothetical protein